MSTVNLLIVGGGGGGFYSNGEDTKISSGKGGRGGRVVRSELYDA